MRFEYYSNVNEEAHIQLNVSKMIAEDLKNFKGKRVRLTLEKIQSKRSNAQNSLFHMYVGIIARELGYGGQDGLEEMKEIIKFKFCKIKKVMESTGEEVEFIQPTHLMKKGEFIELIDSVIRWASAEFCIILPLPSEYGWIDDEKAQK
jgi:septation ring formation regulator EzrA